MCTETPDAFKGAWTLPFRRIPWALPFRLEQDEAIQCFFQRHPGNGPRIELTAVRPCHLPYYIFEGDLKVKFNGVALYDDAGESDAHGRTPASEFVRTNISCPLVSLGADTSSVSAV